MATATTTRRTRAAAQPVVQNVTTRRSGKVHHAHPVLGFAFPACRTGSQTRQPTNGRYVYTAEAVTCERCAPDLGDQVDPEPAEAPQKPAARRTRRATGAERTPTGDPYQGKTSPRAARARRNGAAQAEAAQQAEEIISDETAKVLAKRGTHVEMNEQRKPKCDDETYALAVRVRELRAEGRAWWAIAYELGLPGSGPSVRQGKTGAAKARRLWEQAWGKTYSDTSVPRDTKDRKKERALTEPGRPYFSPDTPDLEVVDLVRGKTVEWCTRLAAGDGVVISLQTAKVDPKGAKVVQGRKGRVLSFYEVIRDEKGREMVGPCRSVYIAQIEKVSL